MKGCLVSAVLENMLTVASCYRESLKKIRLKTTKITPQQ